MIIRLTCNGAGDVRLQCLRDRKDSRKESPAGAAPLVCSSEVQELTTARQNLPRVGFGRLSARNKFTRGARCLVRQLGALIDETDRRKVVFLTGTLPGSTSDAVKALAAWSGWAVQTLLQWVRDTTGDSRVFGVWEYQKRGALHLHMCVACNSESDARKLKQLWKRRWIKVLDSICARAKVDLYQRDSVSSWASRKFLTRTDAQTVEKSVGKYLSKYLSKGSCTARGAASHPPSAWYFCSKTLRRETESRKEETTICNLAPTTAMDLFERIGGMLAVEVSNCFPYVSPYDAMVKGMVCLFSPIHGYCIFEYISRALRCLLDGDRVRGASQPVTMLGAANFFAGRLIA